MSNSKNNKKAAAGIIRRGIAYTIDCFILFGFYGITQIAFLVPLREMIGMDLGWFGSGVNTELYTLVTISLPAFLYFAILESGSRVSIGKWFLRARVVDAESNSGLTMSSGIRRSFVKLLPWELAHIANNLPTPIWYTDEPGFRVAFVVSGVLMLTQIVMVWRRGNHAGIHDWLANSVVVSLKSQNQNQSF